MSKKKIRIFIGIGLLAIVLPIAFLALFRPSDIEAVWMDDSWAYRKKITFGYGSDTTNLKLKLDIDTAALTTDKLQADCDDMRFTDINGQMLRFYLDSGVGACDGASTDYYVLIPTIYNSSVNTIYMYYGNPSAVSASQPVQFSESTLTPTSGPTEASEEKGQGPTSYWKMDEGVDNTCTGGTNDVCDSTVNANNGAITGAAWKAPDLCVVEKCLYFDGSDDVVTVTNADAVDLNVNLAAAFTISAWIRPNSSGEGSGGQLFFKGTETWLRVESDSGNTLDIEASLDLGTSDATINVDSAVTINAWNHVAITYTDDADDEITVYVNGVALGSSTDGDGSLAADANNLLIGGTTTNNFAGFIDEFKIYNYERTAAQLKTDYTSRGSSEGVSVALGTSSLKPLSDGLVGYWNMNETSGNATDLSGNGTTLTNNSTTPFSVAKYANSAELDGSTDYFEAADNTPLSLEEDVTLSAWINNDDTTGSQNIVGKWDGTNNSYLLALEGDELRMYIDSSSNYQTTTAANLSSNSFVHVAGVYSSTAQTVKLYVNGVEQASTTTGTIPASIGDDAGEFVVGADDSPTNYFDGHIDEVRVYGKALTGNEISRLYSWAPSPTAHWKFDENTGSSTAFDSSGNGRNISLSNIDSSNWKNGRLGPGVDLNGSDETGTVTANGVFNYDSFSVGGWIKPDTLKVQNLINKSSYASSWRLFMHNASGGIEFDAISDTYNLTSGGTMTAGQWYHVFATFDASTLNARIYINGTIANQTTFAGGMGGTNNSNLSLGYFPSSNYFDGIFDDFKYYNYARTQGQVVEDMNGGHPIGGSPVASQVYYYGLDEQQGSTANNRGISTQAGTISNATWRTSANCKINGCLNFDGTGDVVTVATASDSDIDFNGSDQFGGSAWVYSTTMPGSGEQDAIIAKWDATTPTRGYRLYLENDDADSTGNFEVEIYDESTDQTIRATGTTDAVSQNTWYHVAFSFNGGIAGAAGDLKLYVNGNQVFSSSANASFLGLEDVSADFTIGEYDATDVVSTDTGFTGFIDEVKIYNTAITNDQVLIDMNANSATNFSTGSVESAQLTDGTGTAPVRYYAFDENTGTSSVLDTSTTGTNGTMNGSMTNSDWVPGKYGSALDFDGSDDWVDAGNMGTTTGTVTLWINPTTTGTDHRIYSQTSGATTQDGATRLDGGELEVWDGSAWQILATGIPANAWTHIAVTSTGGSTTGYINGVRASTVTASFNYSGVNMGIAQLFTGSFGTRFSGKIDDFKVYNYVRTQSQIMYDYSRGGPVGWWKFDECSGATAYDSSGNGISGTLTPGGSGNTTTGACGSGTSTEMWNDGSVGKLNASVGFDATDDYIVMNNTSSTSAVKMQLPFTISAWVYVNSFSTNMLVFANNGWVASGNYYGNRLGIASTGEVTVEFGDGGTINGANRRSKVSTGTVPSGQWVHVAATVRDVADMTIYINGRDAGGAHSGTGDATIAYSSQASYIGKVGTPNVAYDGGSAQYFNGLIDDVRTYNYSLSQSQIQKIMLDSAGARFAPNEGQP